MLLGPLVALVSGGEAAAKTPREGAAAEAKPSRKLGRYRCLVNFTWHDEGSFEMHRLGNYRNKEGKNQRWQKLHTICTVEFICSISYFLGL